MQFKHPEILWALLLLIIPILIHLFQLRRFKKTPFTNVKFLREISIQTRKSSRLKKLLILTARCLAIAAMVFAFAQPYIANQNASNTEEETVIYLDNSFSMQASGTRGILLDRAIQDLIEHIPKEEKIALFTNTNTFNKQRINLLRNDLLKIPFSQQQLSYKEAVLKAKRLFSSNTGNKRLIMISDFQSDKTLSLTLDSTITVNHIPLKPVALKNFSLDSLDLKRKGNKLEITVYALASEISNTAVPVSLYNGEILLAKTAISFANSTKGTAVLTLDDNLETEGKISIQDDGLQYDNTFYFSIETAPKINVISINGSDDSFLEKIYSDDEFNYISYPYNALDYNQILSQQLVILNELQTIPPSLNTILKSFKKQGRSLTIIPGAQIDLNSYNSFLSEMGFSKYASQSNNSLRITEISFGHPLFEQVFNKKVSNFNYPQVSEHYLMKKNASLTALSFENGQSFLLSKNGTYIFTAPLSGKQSNFTKSPLVVPAFYNMGKLSFKIPKLYYTTGIENEIEVNEDLDKDDILHIKSEEYEFIPLQQLKANKVLIKTNFQPEKAGIYKVNNKNKVLRKLAYNYQRKESNTPYFDMKMLASEHGTHYDSVNQLFDEIKNNRSIHELWKWFVTFALVFLAMEILILKFFK